MNPEEAKNHCGECGDPITTQHEIDFELCDECFKEKQEEAKDAFDIDQERADAECKL